MPEKAIEEEAKLLASSPSSTDFATRLATARHLFPSSDLRDPCDFKADLNGLETFFTDWFEEQYELYRPLLVPQVKTVGDILQVVDFLRKNGDDTRQRLLSKCDPLSGQHANIALTFAASLWFSISFDQIHDIVRPGRYLEWHNASSLREAIRAFPPRPVLSENVKLPKTFTAANLEQIAGIKVQWTSNLADHLVLKDDDTKVMLYHQASFLNLHRQCPDSMLNKEFIEETFRTFGLLCPSNDTKSRKWFEKKRREISLDPKVGSCMNLNAAERQTQSFYFWRDRLIVLKQAFDDSEPRTLSMWWRDDRKKVQWYTFWVAALVLLLTIVFGLVQSISGVVQAWAAVKALPR